MPAHPQSPLTLDQTETFTGRSYYADNLDYRLELVVDVFPEQTSIEMQTSTGSTQDLIRFGGITFTDATAGRGLLGWSLPQAGSRC